MAETYIISDTHLGHANSLTFLKKDGSKLRDFASVEEMDEHMIHCWNSVVRPEDKVIHLGDVVIMQWIKLTDRMPNPDDHDRVLIYTEGCDFNGEQVFDVKAETLNECFYADPDDQPEVCRVASHWAAHPRDAGLHPTR